VDLQFFWRKFFVSNSFFTIIFLLFELNSLLGKIEPPLYIRSHAFDYSSGKYLYSENHYEYYEKGSHTHSIIFYRTPGEKDFAKKKIEFFRRKTQPDFLLEDFRTGYYDKAQLKNPAEQIFYVEHRRSANKQVKKKLLQIPGVVVVDGGFDYFIRENFDRINNGEMMKGNFLLVNRQDYFLCRVKKHSDILYKGREAMELHIMPDNFFIRQIADKLVVIYDKKSKRLLEYIGISNLQNDAADDFPKVRIIFQYKPDQLDSI